MKTNPRSTNLDPRHKPNYGIAEAAQYLSLPVATLRSWVVGRHYPVSGHKKFFPPILEIADRKGGLLSFINVVEAHVLSAIRREHGIQLSKVRKAIDYCKREFDSENPLANQRLETDGLNLFVQKYGDLVNISREGQLAIRVLIETYLQRIRRDPTGVPIKLYPFTRRGRADEPSKVVMDPTISFGRPTLVDTNIPTSILAERFKAGDSSEELAEDYGRQKAEIEEALRYEIKVAA